MISIYSIKPKFQKLLKPLLDFLYKNGVSANMITWSAIVLSAVTGLLIWLEPSQNMLLFLPLSLLIRMALNALDGMMARTYHMQSKQGEVLNELGDVVSDLLLYFPLLKLFSLPIYVLITFLFMSVVNEYAGILGKAINGIRQYDGPMGKSDRAFVIGLLSLVFYFTHALIPYIDYIFLVLILLLMLSTFFRIKKTLNPK